ncbi:Zinc finger in N-recognin family protein [Trichomonas vaginalis G3]|uniref:E3 ubiquitin-protein ligase n=1 Tax=Trichomonas vaginalis (strain ATCC PRA-98 / G3) TaxID=412133 RepID=A2ETV4_TRIV3|nr:E3 ubiquitin-protein ligase ubr1 family [Trichomonas vaginalis G3]EAY03909.1 Zinc finger in N-recognin family protein [Trichomonas vaginalis G3]KAI5502815.1 E3 ubiquitin-protein ligase ubr1 family [Trichomonas vaginalis G3]|eukprot:XP_001316132.1 Zinc finger in N-recognin family protein [Trichomonas vaginalis G3]
MDDFLELISTNYVQGMKKAKRILSNNSDDFDKYNGEMKEKASFNRCLVNNNDTNIFVTCKECCLLPVDIFCLKCFQHEKHIGHHVSILRSTQAVCDCGNPNAIREEGWCDKHHNYMNDQRLTPERVSEISKIVKSLLLYSIDICGENRFRKIIKLIEDLSLWGVEYMDIVSQLLFEGDFENSIFGKLMNSYSVFPPQNTEKLDHFFNTIVTSMPFKEGYQRMTPDLLKRSLKFFTDQPNFLKESLDVLSFSTQCMSEPDNFYQIPEFFEILYDCYAKSIGYCLVHEPIVHFRSLDDFDTIGHFYEITLQVLKNHKFIQYKFMNDPTVTIDKIISIFSQLNGVPSIVRQYNEKEPFDNDYYTLSFHFHETGSEMFTFISQRFSEIYNKLTSKEDLEKAKDSVSLILGEFKKAFIDQIETKSTMFDCETFFKDIYHEQFSFFYPVYDLFCQCIMRYSKKNNVSPYYVLENAHFSETDILKVNSVICGCTAGIFAVFCKLFQKNVNNISIISSLIQNSNVIWTDLLLCSLISKENKYLTDKFICQISESFCLQKFLNETEYVEELSLLMASLIRIILILSFYRDWSMFELSKAEWQKAILKCFLKSGCKNRKEINNKSYMFMQAENYDDVISSVADIQRKPTGSELSLKNEKEVPLFSPYITFSDYQLLISKENENLCYLPLQNCEPYLVLSDNYYHLLSYLLDSIAKDDRKQSFVLFYSILMSFRIILHFAEDKMKYKNLVISLMHEPEKTSTGQDLFENFLKENPIFADIKNVKTEKSEETKGVSIKDIMKQFQTENLFDGEDSDEEEEQNEVKCAFCGMAIRNFEPKCLLVTAYNSNLLTVLENNISGYSLPRFPEFMIFRTCGHFCHEICYPKSEIDDVPLILRMYAAKPKPPTCPLDRSICNSKIPIINSEEDQTERVLKFETELQLPDDITLRQNVLQNICLFEILLRTNENYLEKKQTIRLMFSNLLRICFHSKDEEIIYSDVFIQFGMKLFSMKVEDYENILKEFWPKFVTNSLEAGGSDYLMTYIRRCHLLYNLIDENNKFTMPKSVEEFIELHKLPKVENVSKNDDLLVASVPSPCKKFNSSFLPSNFTDYFTQNDKGFTKNLCRTDISVSQCLLCGKFVYSIPIGSSLAKQVKGLEFLRDHIMNCNHGAATPFLHITGSNASGVDVVDHQFITKYDHGSIYVDNFGDTDIGLLRGSILHLEKDLFEEIIEQTMNSELRRLVEEKEPTTLEELQQQQLIRIEINNV